MPALRWGTVAVGFVIAALRGQFDVEVTVWGTVLVCHAAWRTFRPLIYGDVPTAGVVSLVLDAGLTALAVTATGYWNSPFVFCLMTGAIAAGFTEGFAFAVETAIATALAVGIPQFVAQHDVHGFTFQDSAQWTIELVLVALVAGYARRLFGEAEARHTLALDRMSRLAEANALLFSLHQITQTLPASLDLDEVLSSTIGRLRDLIEFDAVLILLRDEATGAWIIGAGEGVRLERSLEENDLPAPLRTAAQSATAQLVTDLGTEDGPGVGVGSGSGLYAPLRARGTLVGLLALEHREVGRYDRRVESLVEGFVESAALAIDNARWFGRLRTVGADEERTRIARDLHDRMGQSLAYLAFELDRVLKRSDRELVHEELLQLRQDVRSVVTEMRETLYDLRTDVSEQHGMTETLSAFLSRVSERASLECELVDDVSGRLPLLQERELWRIAQEAITNVERHARATHLTVRWSCDGAGATLVVSDDGGGFPIGKAGRMDSYGIIGMRERADAIGARLEIDSTLGAGTTVRCRLNQ